MPMGEDSEKKNPPGNSKEGNYAGGGDCVFRARSPISVNAGSHILGWILICEEGV